MSFEKPSTDFLRRLNHSLSGYTELVGGNKIEEEMAPDYQNVYFCYEKDNVVIMDNHRCALWFWVKLTEKSLKYNIIHIDTHYDLGGLKHGSTISRDQLDRFTLNDYLHYKDKADDRMFYFNWANYLLPFIDNYNQNVANLYLIVNQNADIPGESTLKAIKCHVEDPKGYNALPSLNNLFDEKENWIINFDIDFFFKDGIQLYSDVYIEKVLAQIKSFMSIKNTVLTIALSPSCCGGWENSYKVLEKMKSMGIV